MKLHEILILTAVSTATTEARVWTQVVDPMLYRFPGVDTNRLLFIEEKDPFDFQPAAPTVAPQPTPQPTLSPFTMPTAAPTFRHENVDGNGGCKPHEALYELGMRDMWGDGWTGSSITVTRTVHEGDAAGVQFVQEQGPDTEISQVVNVGESAFEDYSVPKQVFSGTLEDGYTGSGYLCLEVDRCYEVQTGGGSFDWEITWQLRKATLGADPQSWDAPLTKGLAPESCYFSVPNANGDQICPNSCGFRSNFSGPVVEAEEEEDEEDPDMPSDMPSLVPSSQPSSFQGSVFR